MYDAVADPYCYLQTTVLKNRAGLRTQRALTRFETAMAAQRADEPLPSGQLSVRHYRAIHRDYSKTCTNGPGISAQCASAKMEACSAIRITSRQKCKRCLRASSKVQ